MPVVSLPSENVPAPPSPNCTLVCAQRAAVKKRLHPARAFLDRLAALEHERARARLGERQRREEPRRAGPYDDGTQPRRRTRLRRRIRRPCRGRGRLYARGKAA